MSELQQDIIFNLIGKKLSGQISDSESKSLSDWIYSSEDARRIYEDLKLYWANIHFSSGNAKMASEKELSNKIWENVFC